MKIKLLLLFFLIGCGSKDKEFEESEQLPRETIDQSTQSQDTIKVPGDVAVDIPVPINGSYLTCKRNQPMLQGMTEAQLDCSLNGIKASALSNVQASFWKQDSSGTRFPLTIIAEDLEQLNWSLSIPSHLVEINEVYASIDFGNGEPALYQSMILDPIVLALDVKFWASGEPSGNEPCVEFWNNTVIAEVDQRNSALPPSPANGRLNDVNCAAIQPFLCRRIAEDPNQRLFISAFSGSQDQWQNACPVGSWFSFPNTVEEFNLVQSLVDNTIRGTWIGLQDQNLVGEFSALRQSF